MPWNELTGKFEDNTPSNTTPYSPGASAPPVTYDPAQRSPLNSSINASDVLYADDLPRMSDDGKNSIPNKWIRVLHMKDGTLYYYEYDTKEHPENASGDMPDYVPVGAKLIKQGVDPTRAEFNQTQTQITSTNKRLDIADANQSRLEAANTAGQSGYVYGTDASGNITPKLDENGKPIPTLAREQLDISRAQLDRQTASQEASTRIQEEQNQIAKDRNAADAIYREKQLEAEKERDRLNGLVSIGKLQADVAHNQFLEWLEKNVKEPFMAMEEQRNRAAEIRSGQALEDARRQNAAIHTQNNEKMAMDVGNRTMDAAVSTLPYMAGPKWGEQFAGALNAIGSGRPQDIHFDAQGLTFDSPDFAKIAEQATARALSHLSPYAASIAQAGDRPGGGYATGDYSGTPMPNMSGAPNTGPSSITALNQLGYAPGTGPVQPTSPVAPSQQAEEWH